MAKTKTIYSSCTHEPLKFGMVAHNFIARTARQVPGVNGFRAWNIDDPKAPSIDKVECACGWHPELGTHYRSADFPKPARS